jgi:hypothetical protein
MNLFGGLLMKQHFVTKKLAISFLVAAISFSSTTALADDALQSKINGVVQVEQSELDAFTGGVNRVDYLLNAADKAINALLPYFVVDNINKRYVIIDGLTSEQLKLVYMGIQQYNSYRIAFVNAYTNQVMPAHEQLKLNRSEDLARLTSLVTEQIVRDKAEIGKLVITIADQTKQLEKLKADLKVYSSYPNNAIMSAITANMKTKISELEASIKKNQERIAYLQNELLTNDAALTRIKTGEIASDQLAYDLAIRVQTHLINYHNHMPVIPASL